jgi:nucleoside-triphosphatase THEP1
MPRLLLWTGPKHSGKTTLLQHLVQTIPARGFTVAGFVAPSRYEDGTLVGFDIVEVNTNRRAPLAARQKDRRDKCGFVLLPEGLKLGMDCLRFAATALVDIVIVDEYGPLELAHRGWRTAVDDLITATDAEVLLVVREELTDRVRREYDNTSCVEFPAHQAQSFAKVVNLLRQKRIRSRGQLAAVVDTCPLASHRRTDEVEMFDQQETS